MFPTPHRRGSNPAGDAAFKTSFLSQGSQGLCRCQGGNGMEKKYSGYSQDHCRDHNPIQMLILHNVVCVTLFKSKTALLLISKLLAKGSTVAIGNHITIISQQITLRHV